MLNSLYISPLISCLNKHPVPLDLTRHFRALTLLDLTHIGRKNQRKDSNSGDYLKSQWLSTSPCFSVKGSHATPAPTTWFFCTAHTKLEELFIGK